MIRRTHLIALLAALATPAIAISAASTYTAAVADPARPAEDIARDADRKPAAMLAFAHVRPGQTIVDYIPSKGYFTRLFSAAVGPSGLVYAVTPQMLLDVFAKIGKAPPPSVTAEPGRGNVHDAIASGGSLNVPAPVDLVWTSQNYHDVHIFGGAAATAQLNTAVFAALKPGGLYVVLDHAGAPGLDEAGVKKLHRIDEAVVKREVLAAGFKLDGESKVLANPADPRTANVFDPSIRGHTDQFILRFRKPG
ncbi:class I SAM-dependent methyltransferase [Sphingomonas sp. CGMCC 1.13654]|uniref:Class I SAM-dependent methyltransferase n=1 Tax=Sphingomonas chungangi TaxID=2683589 RepID=A0A838LAU8_9SPHN|nr:class I SAM-dependent methyltransferase [Sphingomonas chungangi]MBA2936334.1 class I SAM-dependent methyltransferase [Sphingomonas chungangi]MVW55719.1 methyltransferase [Sphingomonas chungangi]